ncbi:unnamed protein product [Effrenium voratum]|uniref:Uncharacterized protein n=1 Tax=Effrenium voratum TaxID=2562239 RepID=A0AA36IX97_9DINO|nr:unnamed protein product [Effrenium voratum]
MASTFEVFNLAAPCAAATGSVWFSPQQPYRDVRDYQLAPHHQGMAHPPQNEAVRRDLLRYLGANGISHSRRSVRRPASDAEARPRPRWRPSGSCQRQASLGFLAPEAPDPLPSFSRAGSRGPRVQRKAG